MSQDNKPETHVIRDVEKLIVIKDVDGNVIIEFKGILDLVLTATLIPSILIELATFCSGFGLLLMVFFAPVGVGALVASIILKSKRNIILSSTFLGIVVLEYFCWMIIAFSVGYFSMFSDIINRLNR